MGGSERFCLPSRNVTRAQASAISAEKPDHHFLFELKRSTLSENPSPNDIIHIHGGRIRKTYNPLSVYARIELKSPILW